MENPGLLWCLVCCPVLSPLHHSTSPTTHTAEVTTMHYDTVFQVQTLNNHEILTALFL